MSASYLAAGRAFLGLALDARNGAQRCTYPPVSRMNRILMGYYARKAITQARLAGVNPRILRSA